MQHKVKRGNGAIKGKSLTFSRLFDSVPCPTLYKTDLQKVLLYFYAATSTPMTITTTNSNNHHYINNKQSHPIQKQLKHD